MPTYNQDDFSYTQRPPEKFGRGQYRVEGAVFKKGNPKPIGRVSELGTTKAKAEKDARAQANRLMSQFNENLEDK
jgi:hypothetical protein